MGINEIIKIGDRLRLIRKKHGISQKKMSEILCIPYSTYSNYENNNREPSKEVLEKIALLFDVSVMDLINFSDRYNLPGKNSAVYAFGSEEHQIAIDINSDLEQLNLDGKREARKQVNLISKIPEYRKETDSTMPIAAHNDDADDEEQQKLMREDIDEL